MAALQIHRPGTDLVIEERWRDVLWAAVPHRVLESTADLLIGWVPAGTGSVYATNRGRPETAGLTRDERKLLALETLDAYAAGFAETPGKLSVYRPDRWSRIHLGFDPADGHFLGWYVDFQLPLRATPTGYATKDLVLDLWIDPDRNWEWKDRDDFDLAVAHGLFEPAVRAALDPEAELILAELEHHRPPFDDDLSAFRPDPGWPLPVLPPTHAWAGPEWTLRPGQSPRT